MKKYYSVFVILFVFINCSPKNIEAIYGSEDEVQNYIEFKSDNSFFKKEYNHNVVGTYRLEGEIITFVFVDGSAYRANIRENIMTDEKGAKWILWAGGKTGIDYEKAHIDKSKELKNIRKKFDALVAKGLLTMEQADIQYEQAEKNLNTLTNNKNRK